MTDLGAQTWPEVAAALDAAEVWLAVPLGSTEQHGPHLPLSTDTTIAVALAERLAGLMPGRIVVAPAIPYGSSGEHAGFPGTLSIGQDALEAVVVELVRSADAFAGVVLVSGHGGNAAPIARAAALLEGEGRSVLVWSPRLAAPHDAHAGRTETSLVFAVDPGAVRTGALASGNTDPIADLLPALVSGGVRAVSPNGVLGDPVGASVYEGERLLDALTADLLAATLSKFGHLASESAGR